MYVFHKLCVCTFKADKCVAAVHENCSKMPGRTVLSQSAIDLTRKEPTPEPVDLTRSALEKKNNQKSALKRIDSCISLKFYSGAPSSSTTLLDLETVSEKIKKKKRKRDRMFTKYIPYSENTFPLSCNLSSIAKEPKSPAKSLIEDESNGMCISVLTPSKRENSTENITASVSVPKFDPMSPLPKAAPAYSIASSYFPNMFPFEIASPRGPQQGSVSTIADPDFDATEPCTRSALGSSYLNEVDRPFMPQLQWQFEQTSSCKPLSSASCGGTPNKGESASAVDGPDVSNPVVRAEDNTVKEEHKEVAVTSNVCRAYKMKHPVKCRYCERTFWSHTGRYYHEAIHTGKWLFQCKYCDAGFMQRKAYDSHMRAKHKPRVLEVLMQGSSDEKAPVSVKDGHIKNLGVNPQDHV